jgi:hypothetical protein
MELLGSRFNVFPKFVWKGRHLFAGLAIGAGLTALSRSQGFLTAIPDKEAMYINLLGMVCAATWMSMTLERHLEQQREKRMELEKAKKIRQRVREDIKALELEHRVALRWFVRQDKQQVLEYKRAMVLEDLADLNILEEGATRTRIKYRVPDWLWNELKQQKYSEAIPKSVRRTLDSEIPPWQQKVRAGYGEAVEHGSVGAMFALK